VTLNDLGLNSSTLPISTLSIPACRCVSER
jgi:hypothetical protein